MNLPGLISGAGVVAGGYRTAEEQIRKAEEQRLKLQQMRLEQAARDRAEQARRSMPRVEIPAPPAAGGALPAAVPTAIPGLPALQDTTLAQAPRPPVPQAAAPTPDAWAERGPGEGDGAAAPAPQTYVGPAPAPVTPLRPAGAPVDEAALRRQQGVFRMHAMRVRDATVALDALRSQGAAPARIARQEELVRREQGLLDAARQGLERITGAPVPAAPTAPVPAPQQDVIAPGVRIPPEVQAQRDAEAAKIRAQELGTVARADRELAQVEQALRQRGMDSTRRGILEWQRSQITAARAILAGQAPAAAAPPAAAAGAPAAPPAATPGSLVPAIMTPAAGVRATAPVEPAQAMEFYRVNPSAIMADQRYANETYTSQRQIAVDEATARQANLDATAKAARAQLVGQYNALFNAGQTAEANAVYEKITALDAQYRDASVQNIFTARTALLELDNNFKAARLVLAGSAAAAQLEYQNNPAGAAQMLSYVYGQPIQLQPVDDGTFRMLLPRPNGELGQAGVFSRAQLLDMVQSATSQAYRASKAEMAGKAALERLKGELKVNEQQAAMIRDLALESVRGANKRAEITLEGQQFRAQADGNGGVILYTPNGQTVGRVVQRQVTVDGQPSTSFVLEPIQISR